MARDIKAVRELLRSVEALASDATILALEGSSLPERIQWENSMMSFRHLTDSLTWVVENTKSAIASEAAERKRIEKIDAWQKKSDAKLRAKQTAKQAADQ